ncbi:hypothetical protein LTS17_004172 [Exophiala oligosperma]
MASSQNLSVQSICATLQRDYSACDISDALLKLNVPAAGFLVDLAPLQGLSRKPHRIVAPVSTVVLVPKSWSDASSFVPPLPQASNIPQGKNWTDCPPPGAVVLIQQPKEHISAILGDIMVTRLQKRGILGVVADGRIRDLKSCREVCEEGSFQAWSTGVSAAPPSLEAKPWAYDISLKVGDVTVNPGDILCADEEDGAVVVIPKAQLQAVYKLLPVLKRASDGVLADVQKGFSLPEAVQRHPDFYSNYK